MSVVDTPLTCLIIADDFTGACDTGLQFVRSGFVTRVFLDPADIGAADVEVAVVDSETRNMNADAAADRLLQWAADLASFKSRLCYKKVDSTLRGPIGAEVEVLMQNGGFDLCLMVPALPTAGRCTVGGYHLLNGVPVDRTAMGRDIGAPVTDAYVPRLLGATTALTVGCLDLGVVEQGPEAIVDEIARLRQRPCRVIVCDAAAPADLEAIAQAAAQLETTPLLCGSAGLAEPLAAAFGLKAGGHSLAPLEGGPGPVLILVGSNQALTQEQIKVAGLRGWVIEPDATEPAKGLQAALLKGEHAVLRLDTLDRDMGLEVVQQGVRLLATQGRRLCTLAKPAGLAVTGGGTGVEVLAALEARQVEIVEPLEENVPLCRVGDGPFAGLPLVTKAGALGSLEVFTKAVDRLGGATQGRRPLLGITMGDPCGIGPEVIVKALAQAEVYRFCRPLVIGHPALLTENLDFTPQTIRIQPVDSPESGIYQPGCIDVYNPVDVDLGLLHRGQVCPEAGRAAVEWVKTAVDLAMKNRIDGMVTAPLNKEAMNRAGHQYAGHTELLGDRTGTKHYRMMLAAERLKVVHVTTHIALHEVPARLTPERLWATLELTQNTLLDLGYEQPRIAVAGLNPHAGESGLFGHEDAERIRPAVEKAQQAGWRVEGPLPGDTLFHRAYQGKFDAVVAMYHDQGHIPVKLVAFADAVNVTLGLPIVRTSVDHGTAFDIVGKGIADHGNMIYALRLGARLGAARRDKAGSD
jgi:4-hydroxythreonine-4-phosphate dehydrogenase